MVQHLMRQHEKYQMICDYALTISHDMGVINDTKRCETPMQKLQEIITAVKAIIKNLENICFRGFILFTFYLFYDIFIHIDTNYGGENG